MSSDTGMDAIERRDGLKQLAPQITEIEKEIRSVVTDLAVIKAGRAREESARKIVWASAVALLVQLGMFIYGYGALTQRIDQLDNTRLAKEVAVLESGVSTLIRSVESIRDEDTDLRRSILHVDKELNDNMNALKNDINAKTVDRFYRSDWLAAKDWIDSELKRLGQTCSTQRDWAEAKIDGMETRMLVLERQMRLDGGGGGKHRNRGQGGGHEP